MEVVAPPTCGRGPVLGGRACCGGGGARGMLLLLPLGPVCGRGG